MKTVMGAGFCLMVGLWISQVTAEEIQWRAASQPAGSNTGGPGISLSNAQPVPETVEFYPSQPSAPRPLMSGPFFAPSTVRAKGDDAKPLPQITDVPPGIQIIQENQKPEFVPKSPGKLQPGPSPLLPMPSMQPESIEMMEPGAIEMMDMPMEGTVTSSDSCGCGIGAGSFWHGDSCCGLSCGKTCGTCLSSPCCVSECGCCCYDSNRTHLWVNADFLVYAFSRPNTPPLLTTGGVNGGAGPALGKPGTSVLYGGDTFDNPIHEGGRIEFGMWLPNCDDWGVQVGGFFFPQISSHFTSGGGIVGRPFTNDTPGGVNGPTTEPVNGFAGVTGTATVDYSSQLFGVEADLRHKLCCGPDWHLDVLFGYRYMQLNEGIVINENLNTGIPIHVTDSFTTRNQFNGGQIGLDGEYRFCGRWFVGGQVKVAVGDMRQQLTIFGAETDAGFYKTGTGFFANAANAGTYAQNRLCVIPEVNLKLGVDITDRLRVYVGYNFLYMSSVLRPGDQIDTTINTNNIAGFLTPATQVGPARPAVPMATSSFWAQGLNAGVEYHY